MSSAKKVCVVIPCRNEKNYIGKCIKSVLSSTYPKELLEVCVADGKSNDGTIEEIQKILKEDKRLILLTNEHQTTPHALNLGIVYSDADVIIILGAHSEVYPDFVSENMNALEQHPDAGCVGGIIENINENTLAGGIAKAMSSPFGVGNAHFRTGQHEGYVDTVAFGAYRKEVFAKAGLFDESLIRNQDDEFNFRLIKSGYKIYLSKSIRSKYYVRAKLSKLIRQYYQYGYWKVFVNTKHKTITTGRQVVPSILVLLAGSGVLSFLVPAYLYIYLLGICVYGLAAIISAARVASSVSEFFISTIVFPSLHFSYGLGYLEGIWNFVILKKNVNAVHSAITR